MTHNFDLSKVIKMISLRIEKSHYLRSNHSEAPKTNNYITKIFVHSIKMSNPLKDLGLEDLQATAKIRGIKNYKSMSRDELLSIIFPSKKVKKQKKIKKQKEVFLKQE